ncbi:XrtV sorting system accessory protein [Pseudokordiimonas caeni]|uniref:XrtV sorting system accessory protein n=1 Tax=Pseudokordiimonas caeni TaxID=2997908 RepID=UPI002812722E|nr:XrtV sorting system accessory protein [Pseudokordiimonas caeni]
MSTIFDFVTVAIFVAIVGMFFQFSRREDQNIAAYIWPALGCAFANYFGNKGFDLIAWIMIAATLGYVFLFILRRQGVPDERDDS